MNFKTSIYEENSDNVIELIIDERSYRVINFEININTIAEVTTLYGGTQKPIATNREFQLNIMLPYDEGIRLSRDFDFNINKEYDIEINREGEVIVSGKGIFEPIPYKYDVDGACCNVEIYVYQTEPAYIDDLAITNAKITTNVDKTKITTDKIELPGIKDDQEAKRREENFKRFIINKSRRQGQSRLAEAYNDRFNFFKFKKARELNKKAANEKRRKLIGKKLKNEYVINKRIRDDINTIGWGNTTAVTNDPSNSKTKQNKAQIAKPKKRAIDL